ncbi:ATPase H(+)-transporting accessory protein 2-like [Homarus americanus]|uniref:ATPase H(+)-transporting accessory protein 2-like n=1 Tax=Homarus americanus TaxID=6706 RepID=A0A8J5MLK6_HOMAM|nr:ATPase H(+)-transporting accessory protein 2-like [Homarus americanus]
MASQVIGSVVLLSLLSSVYCGELTVAFSPPTVRFGSGGILRATDLDDVLAASLGYTPAQSSPWKGLTITSPFSAPTAAVVVEIHGGGASIRQEGSTYGLKEDTSIDDVFHRLKSVSGDDRIQHSIPATKVLNSSLEPDGTFLSEMSALFLTAQLAEEISTAPHGGQDVIFLEVDSLSQVVKTYGLGSPQVVEACDILRTELAKVTDYMRRLYKDRVLVVSATVDQLEKITRSTRSIVQQFEDSALNIATEYSSNYPAIFNIILWLSIILFLAVLATSVAMATMDPGRDSIIYRMTNPRMKKDN